MDKGLLGKGNQRTNPPRRPNQAKTTRTTKTSPQTTQEKVIHAVLGAEFNPILEELFVWMARVQQIGKEMKDLKASDAYREKLEEEFEDLLNQIGARSYSLVDQSHEMTKE